MPGLSFPVAEAAYERLLTLPLHAGMDDADVDDVVAALDKVAEAYLVDVMSEDVRQSTEPVVVAVDPGPDGLDAAAGQGASSRSRDRPLLGLDRRRRAGHPGRLVVVVATTDGCRRRRRRGTRPLTSVSPSTAARPTTFCRRCFDAVAPYAPDVVVRQTADNPFPIRRSPRARSGAPRRELDYVGIDGWPLGIAAEACRMRRARRRLTGRRRRPPIAST